MALLFSPLVILKYFGIEHFEVFAGLSFTCFRAWEAYNNNTNREHPNFINYLVYLVFFPTLIAGPLTHFKEFNSNLNTDDGNIPYHDLWILFLLGVLQKFVVAESINQFWMVNLDYKSKLISDILSNMYCYSTYLYFDFAGYSNMAIGLAGFFGVTIPKNFDHPYLSLNPRDFWKRWHITLSKWLMDHLFIPLYKYSLGLPFFRNHPLLSQNLALSLTFVLVSIWAGFKPLYLLCGIIIGVINSSHNLYVNLRSKNYFTVVDSIPLKIRKFLSWFLTIHSFLFAFYIFSGRFPYLLDYNQDKLPPIIRTETSQVTQDNESTPRYNLRNSSIEIEYDTLSEIYYKIKTIKTKGPITLNQSFDNSFILIDDYQNKYQIDLRFSAYFKLREEFYGRSEVVNIPISKLSSSGLIKLPLNNYTIDNIKVFKKDKNELWSELTKFNSQSFIHLGQLTINHEHLSYRILIFEKHFFPININLNGKFREINLIE